MIYDITHKTIFEYGVEVLISHHQLHLKPRPTRSQECLRSFLSIDPAPTIIRNDRDYFGNETAYLTIEDPHAALSVSMASSVDVAPQKVPNAAVTPAWETVFESLEPTETTKALDVYQFAFDSRFVAETDMVLDYARPSFEPGRPVLEAAIDLTHRINRDFAYEGGVTDIYTPLDEVLTLRRGVCQDFAHLQIACLRAFGIPARYVSGYIRTYTDDDEDKLTGADASHAWVSVWTPGSGWIDLDPTNDCIVGGEHITVAWGRDYGDVSPINGLVVGGGEHSIDVAVSVVPRES